MKPIETFELAIDRAEHFLTLYDLVQDSRTRSVRKDWAAKFLKIMPWSVNNAIVRVDGKDRNSVLILSEKLGIGREQFSHTYASELLRSAVVSAVSAQDRYFHDVVVHHSLKMLIKKEEDVPKELKKISIPLIETKRAIDRARKPGNTRPRGVIKSALQQQLHRQFTFQNPYSVIKAAQMLGVEDFWGKVAIKMPGKPAKGEITTTLRKISARRNQIVHEADIIVSTRAPGTRTRPIKMQVTKTWVEWTGIFVRAADLVIEDAV